MGHGIFLKLYLLQKVRTVYHEVLFRPAQVSHPEVPTEEPEHQALLQVLHTHTLYRSCSVEGKVRQPSLF